MNVTYGSKNLEKYFSDLKAMKKKLGPENTKSVKKHYDRLKASDYFGIFLKIGLGHPERLTGGDTIRYSLHITGNIRLIFNLLNTTAEDINNCTEIEIEGVCDYHGGKENWYIK